MVSYTGIDIHPGVSILGLKSSADTRPAVIESKRKLRNFIVDGVRLGGLVVW